MISFNRLFCLLCVFALFAGDRSSALVFCRADYIEGFEGELAKAHGAIGYGTTTDASKIKIYITTKHTSDGDYIYAQSNFLSDGATNPTKAAMKIGDVKDLDSLLTNIVYTNQADLDADSHNLAQGSNSAEVDVDDSLFDSSGKPALDLSGAGNITYLEANGNRSRLLPNESGKPPPFLAELTGNLRIKFRPGSNPSTLLDKLKTTSFKKSDFSFLNLISESAVENATSSSGLQQFETQGVLPNSEQAISSLIQSYNGKILIALFHSDGTNAVIEDAAGNQTASIPLAKLAQVAYDAKCTLIALGCTSGHANVAAGSAEAFNPVTAIRSIQQALGSATLGEFADKLTGNNFHIVFDDKLMEPAFAFESQHPLSPDDVDSQSEPNVTPSLVGFFVIPPIALIAPPVVTNTQSSTPTATDSNTDTSLTIWYWIVGALGVAGVMIRLARR